MEGHRKGFTLIELLVVIVIIGIASTIIAVKSSHYYAQNKSSERLTKDIRAYIELAQKQAIFTMSMLGLRVAGNYYQVVILTDSNAKQQWHPLAETDPFWQNQPIPSNLVIQVNAQHPTDNTSKSVPFAPQILLYPSGEITPFILSVHQLNSRESVSLKGTGAGEMTITRSEI